MGKYSIFGLSSGSSLVELHKNEHGRIIVDARTDFGNARCCFNIEQASKMRDALTLLIERKA